MPVRCVLWRLCIRAFSIGLLLTVCGPVVAQPPPPQLVAETDPLSPAEQQKKFHLPPGFEIELFDQGIEDAKAALEFEELVLESPTEVPTGEPEFLDVAAYREEMTSLAAINPSAAVLASFTRLERLLRQKVEVIQADLRRARPVSTRQLGELASKQGLWSSQELAAFHDLVQLRNVASHEEVLNLDESRAYEFSELALRLIVALWQAGAEEMPEPSGE